MSRFFSLIKSDLKRIDGSGKRKIIHFLFNSNFRAVFSFRVNNFVYYNISRGLAFLLHNRHRRKYGVDIYPAANIEGGFYIVHLGGIVIGDKCKIGKNVTVQSCVTLGQKDKDSGFPIIGDDVYIGTGAKILGEVKIGSKSTVGANSVVLKSFSNGSVIAGVPAKKLN